MKNYKGKSWRGHNFYKGRKVEINNWNDNKKESEEDRGKKESR